jgi:hypothetical protein
MERKRRSRSLFFSSFLFFFLSSLQLPSEVASDFTVGSIVSSGTACTTSQSFGDLLTPFGDATIGGPMFVAPSGVYSFNSGTTEYLSRSILLRDAPPNSLGK